MAARPRPAGPDEESPLATARTELTVLALLLLAAAAADWWVLGSNR